MGILVNNMLFVVAFFGYAEGYANLPYDSDGVYNRREHSAQNNDVTYRDYAVGDKMSGGSLRNCGAPFMECFVAAKTASPTTVVGVIITEIPSDPDYIPEVQELIREKLPPAKKNDTLGLIFMVEVIVEWRGKGIATALIDKKLSLIRQAMPKVAAMFLDVSVGNKAAISLYNKTGFEVVTEDEVWISMVHYLL